MHDPGNGMVSFIDPKYGPEWLAVMTQIPGVLMFAITDIHDDEAEPQWLVMDEKMIGQLSSLLLEWQITNETSKGNNE